MKITSRSQASSLERPLEGGHFTGPASSFAFHSAGPVSAVGVALVHFEAGVRNHWHSHAGGQVLHVVEGEGWVQSRGGEPERIRAGDVVSVPAAEVHWHGAGAAGPMSHISIAMGEIEWLEEAPAPPE